MLIFQLIFKVGDMQIRLGCENLCVINSKKVSVETIFPLQTR